ncbi:hypothetical protein NUW58_g6053 [Xylaria curta]|uniref:Uncharacterized protein n=1 Tax=Xylaria curta TaxID=42375 RepID=A0ACC1NZT0_9PEZI|nr:hypothetical protein NUW58_g6053 [Xylaria curta]
MALAHESGADEQTRDLRSHAHQTKRVKDHFHKWSRGKRPGAGVKFEHVEYDHHWSESEEQQKKFRPSSLPSDKHVPSPNINKTGSYRSSYLPQSYWSPKADILVELQDPANMSSSLRELLPSPHTRQKQSVSENDVLYSFDKAESPGKPLPLRLYVKTNPKETERFVEKEYEILDFNGDPVTGRKALKDLHRGKTAPPAQEPEVVEDEGFELV